jgi:site-specific recombinase XerD
MSYTTPLALFEDRAEADIPLADLCQAYYDYLAGREMPASQQTIRAYRGALDSFMKSLALHNKPLVIGEMTQLNVRLWVKDLRDGAQPTARKGRPTQKCTDGSIGPRYAAIKAFTNGFIRKELKLTKRDLLEDMKRWKKKDPTRKGLEADEIKAVRNCFDEPTFEMVRDRTIFEVHMATAFRLSTVMKIEILNLNRVSGLVRVTVKGDKTQLGKLDPAALAHVRAYQRLRPESDSPLLFVQDNGKPLTKGGTNMIWRRIKRRSGVKRLGSHLIRYTVVQNAARNGATIAECQGILGHESDKMARHYVGDAHKVAEAETMAKYSMAAA